MSRANQIGACLIALVMGGVGFLLLRPGSRSAPEIGQSVPNFTLPTLSRRQTALRDYRHHVVVLNFWATWCPPCVEETPSLERFAEQMRQQGIEVIGVSVDQDPNALQTFADKFHLTFPIAQDPQQQVASRYGTFKFPETYIVDRYGRLAEKIIGPTDWQDPRLIAFVTELARPGTP